MFVFLGWVTEKDWSQGTTNLHLDISDACNLMVYVGIPEDEPPEAEETLVSVSGVEYDTHHPIIHAPTDRTSSFIQNL